MVDINDPVAMRPLWDAAIDQTLREFGWDKLADRKQREALIDRAVRSTTTPWHRKNWNNPHHVAIWSVRDIRAEFRRLSGST